MLTEVRQRRVVDLVYERGSISVTSLAKILQVSEASVRRDLEHLASQGLIERVRGGACTPRGGIRPEADRSGFEVVATQASVAKRAIAARAAELVDDGQIIAIDIGTTPFAMCEHLLTRSLTVVTASLAVVRALAEAPRIDIIVLGGVLRPNYQSMVGVLTESNLRQVRVDLAFLGCSGIRPDGSVIDSTPSEVPIKRALLDIATEAWLLADHEKFPGSGVLEVAPVTRFSGLITDIPLTEQELALSDDSNLEVLSA